MTHKSVEDIERELTNLNFFTRYDEQVPYGAQQVDQIKLQNAVKTLCIEHLVKPFIKCLRLMVDSGADAHARVQKLEKFRLIDEEMKTLQGLNLTEEERK